MNLTNIKDYMHDGANYQLHHCSGQIVPTLSYARPRPGPSTSGKSTYYRRLSEITTQVWSLAPDHHLRRDAEVLPSDVVDWDGRYYASREQALAAVIAACDLREANVAKTAANRAAREEDDDDDEAIETFLDERDEEPAPADLHDPETFAAFFADRD